MKSITVDCCATGYDCTPGSPYTCANDFTDRLWGDMWAMYGWGSDSETTSDSFTYDVGKIPMLLTH